MFLARKTMKWNQLLYSVSLALLAGCAQPQQPPTTKMKQSAGTDEPRRGWGESPPPARPDPAEAARRWANQVENLRETLLGRDDHEYRGYDFYFFGVGYIKECPVGLSLGSLQYTQTPQDFVDQVWCENLCRILEQLRNQGVEAKLAVPFLKSYLGILEKRTGFGHTERERCKKELSETIKALEPLEVAVVRKVLQNTEPLLRCAAAEAAARMGADAKEALPELRALLQDAYPRVRFAAALALLELDFKEGRAALPVLIEDLKDKKVRALYRHVEQAVPSIANVILKEVEWQPRALAAQAMGDIGTPAKAAIPYLTSVLNDQSVELRTAAAAALQKIQPPK